MIQFSIPIRFIGFFHPFITGETRSGTRIVRGSVAILTRQGFILCSAEHTFGFILFLSLGFLKNRVPLDHFLQGAIVAKDFLGKRPAVKAS